MNSPLVSGHWGLNAVAALAIGGLAISLRVPSCYESFWIDELHTAWTVWDEIGDVALRAELGNQSPVYFFGVWLWKQLFGGSELALRFSSVLAVAAACAALTYGLARWCRSTTAGIAAGLVLACEDNAIFYGTELRPYAWVILFSTLATLCALRLFAVPSRHDARWAWIALVFATLLATICQPTAFGVLVWIYPTLALRWLLGGARRDLFRVSLLDWILVSTVIASLLALWKVSLARSWTQRELWNSFASSKHGSDIWTLWNWESLWAAPFAAMAVAFVTARVFRRPTPAIIPPMMVVAGVIVVSTLTNWVVSLNGWAPIWHRRYLIAALPMLAAICGGAVGAWVSLAAELPFSFKGISPSKRIRVNRRFVQTLVGVVWMVVFVGTLLVQQSTFERLREGSALAVRGEDWRGAVAWIRADCNEHSRVWVDCGLIESQSRLAPRTKMINWTAPDEPELEYLSMAVRGPYVTGLEIEPMPPDSLLGSIGSLAGQPDRMYIISRRRADSIGYAGLLDWPVRIRQRIITKSFGGRDGRGSSRQAEPAG